jgi:hypothetical protein
MYRTLFDIAALADWVRLARLHPDIFHSDVSDYLKTLSWLVLSNLAPIGGNYLWRGMIYMQSHEYASMAERVACGNAKHDQ